MAHEIKRHCPIAMTLAEVNVSRVRKGKRNVLMCGFAYKCDSFKNDKVRGWKFDPECSKEQAKEFWRRYL